MNIFLKDYHTQLKNFRQYLTLQIQRILLEELCPEAFQHGFTSSLDVPFLKEMQLLMYHKSIKGAVVYTVSYEKYRDRRSQAIVKWLTSNITLSSSFCQKKLQPRILSDLHWS